MQSQPKFNGEYITTVDSLCRAIQGKKLLIMAGSGVSLMDDIAPGVIDFVKHFLTGLADRALTVEQGIDFPTFSIGLFTKVLVKYFENSTQASRKALLDFPCVMSKPKRIAKIAKSVKDIKFEELLRFCIDNGVDVDSILQSTYTGATGTFNFNHSALAFLAKQCGVTIITTNFDLGIENAGFSNSIVPNKEGRWERKELPNEPVLAKLHGCAQKGGFVATSERLLSMRSRQEFSFLQNWCSNATVLMIGYSGTGDIDIAPHFEQLPKTTTLLWANHKKEKPPFEGSLVVCDLKADGSENLLLQLASKLGWQRPTKIAEAPWKSSVLTAALSKICPFVAARCLVDIIGRFEPKAFLYDYVASMKLDASPSNQQRYIDWCFRRRIDPPPLRTGHNNETRRMLKRFTAIPEAATYISVWSVFADWRTGKKRALMDSASLIQSDLSNEHPEVRQRIYGIFLSIVAERLWSSASDSIRRSILQQYEAEICIAGSVLANQELEEQQSLESHFTGQLRLNEVYFWKAVSDIDPIGRKTCATDIVNNLIKLRNEAANLKVFDSAIFIDHALLGIRKFCTKYPERLEFPNGFKPPEEDLPLNTFSRQKKRCAYKKRFSFLRSSFLGRLFFNFLEINMLGLRETFFQEPLLKYYTWIGMRWELALLLKAIDYGIP
jgi:hypothetical protein